MTTNPALGILAGGGTMPAQVAAAAQAAGRPVFLVGLEGFAEPAVLAPFPHEIIRLGACGQILDALRRHSVGKIVMVGPVRRPSLLNLRPDAEGLRIFGRIGAAAFAGDDGLLKAVVRVLGEEGFSVVGAHEVLSEALGPRGLLTRTAPDDQALSDIARGIAVARALGAADVGQACIVQQGMVLCVEAAEGTDAMIGRARDLDRGGPGGVLVKLVKPGQDRRADLPTIGLDTIRAICAAGLRGVAFEAGGTILAERQSAIALCDDRGKFLLGLDPNQFNGDSP